MFKRLATLVILVVACSCTSFAQSNTDWPTYRTDGHTKSNGINLTIKYPNNWDRKEGKRPHIVQKFISPDHRAYAMIVIQDLGLPAETTISQEEITAFFEPSELKTMVPDGMQLVDAQKTKIKGLPAGILEYKANMQHIGISVDQQVLSLIFIDKKSMIQLQFAVGGPRGVDTSRLMQQYKPLFMQIANTVVLPDKWREAAAASTASPITSGTQVSENSLPMESLYGANWGATLLVSFLLTWGVGLAPPVVIRFLLARRPIGKGAAIGITSIFFIFNLVLFAALGSQSKSHGALALVALASYAILRKGVPPQVIA